MSHPFLTYPAPAKLNLSLKVVGRREDGYHLLETVFRFIDLSDDVALAVRDDGVVELLNPIAGVAPQDDLTVRAARLLQRAAGVGQGVSIRLDKRIPMGGGLGGGSSDAATVLLALNRAWGCGLTRERLMELGLSLGADVPVFLFGRNAYATGIGEELSAIDVPDAWYLVLHPGVHVPTAKVFASPLLTRNSPLGIMPILETTQQRRNDLQSVVCEMFPEVSQALSELRKYGSPLMTGSGSCVFLECGSQQEAEKVYRLVSDRYRGFVARGLAQHPLRDIV
jgi:4-diphosphocytidyl-2-C-methyl-D-erythritol kinase